MKLFKTLVLAIAVMAFVPAIGNAAMSPSTGGGYVGVLVGPSFLSNGGGTQIDFGAHGDWFVMPNISAGAYVTYESLGSVNAGALGSASSSLVTLAAEANYFFMGDRNLYAGGKLGLGFGSSSVNLGAGSSSSSSTSLVVGPAIGYMYPVAANITVGGEANYLIYTASGSSNAFNILGQINYMF